jgi:quercetin dioxygenase-like cupin family protein
MTRPSIAGGVLFDPAALDPELREEPAYRDSGYTARTLVREPDLRVVLIVMKAGARMLDHQVERTASVHALSGRLRLHLPGKPVELPAHHLLALEAGVRHDVEALEQSALLLTIGWRDDARQ